MNGLKIAVNTRHLIRKELEGIGWFTHELLRRMVEAHPEVDFYFIFDRKFDPSFIYGDNVKGIVVGPPARHVFLYYVWYDFMVRRTLKKLQPDVFLSPDSINLLHPVCPSVTVLHDINFITRPQYISSLLRSFYTKRSKAIAQNSDLLITVSEFSKKEIVEHLNVEEAKVKVVYNACREGFERLDEEEKTKVRRKFAAGEEYFLFVGGMYRRKNLIGLLSAFELVKKRSNSPKKLLIVGKSVGESADFLSALDRSPFKNDVILAGRVDDDKEVQRIMASAFALCYVSILEGFGMPMVEAMRSGIPVIASNTSSMPEIGGDAALYADPFDIEDIAGRMQDMIEDEELRKELIGKAELQVEKFDWNLSAGLLWQSLVEVVNQSKDA